MKKILIILIALLFNSCNKKSDLNSTSVAVSIKTNQDTLYPGEQFYGKVFISFSGDTSNIINDVTFYYKGLEIASLKDTAKFTFIVGEDNSYSIRKVDYELKAIYKINNKIDSSKTIKTYWVSQKLNNKRAEGMLKSNKRIGRWEFWHDDKHIYPSKITIYKNGLKNGYDSTFNSPFFNRNNNLSSVQHYKKQFIVWQIIRIMGIAIKSDLKKTIKW